MKKSNIVSKSKISFLCFFSIALNVYITITETNSCHMHIGIRGLCGINKPLPGINYWQKSSILDVEGFLDPPQHDEQHKK